MRRLYQAANRIEAQFLRDFLCDHRISASILDDYLSGAAGELPVDIYPTVWVIDEDDLPQAQELLKRFLDGSPGQSRVAWVCPNCGTTGEPGFDLCWNCGSPRSERYD